MPSAADIRAGGAFVELYTKNGPLYAGLKNAQRRVKAFASGAMSYGRNLLALGGAVTGPLVASAKLFASVGDDLDKMSARTGVAVESLSELGFAAEQGGASLGDVEAGLKGMQRALTNAEKGLSRPIENLAMLGMTIDDLRGLDPEQQFEKIAAALEQVEDPSLRAGIAMQLFGGAGQKLLPMMQGLAAARQQARDLGLVVSTEDATRAAKFTDQLNILRRVLMDGVFSAGSAVADVLGDMVMKIVKVAKAGAEWIDENRALFVTILKIAGIVTAAGAGLMALGAAAMALSGIIGGLATAVTVVGTVLGTLASVVGFLLSPIGLVTAAVVGLAGYFLYASGAAGSAAEWIGDKFGQLMGFAQETFGAIKDAMAAGDMQLAAEVMWAAIKVAWVTGTGWLRQTWADLRFFLVKTWGEAAFGVLDTLNYLWSSMVDGFWSAADGVVDAWKWAEEGLAKGIGWVIAKLQGLNPDDVLATLSDDYDRQQAGRDAKRNDRDQALQETADDRYAAIETARRDWMQGAAAKHEAQIAGAKDGLEAAQRRFDAAKEAARDARERSEADADTEEPDTRDASTLPDRQPAPQPAGDKASDDALAKSAGMFTAAGYKMLAGTHDPSIKVQQDQLSTLKTIAENTKDKKPAEVSEHPAIVVDGAADTRDPSPEQPKVIGNSTARRPLSNVQHDQLSTLKAIAKNTKDTRPAELGPSKEPSGHPITIVDRDSDARGPSPGQPKVIVDGAAGAAPTPSTEQSRDWGDLPTLWDAVTRAVQQLQVSDKDMPAPGPARPTGTPELANAKAVIDGQRVSARAPDRVAHESDHAQALLAVQRDQLVALGAIVTNTRPKPVLKEAVPPKR